MKIRFSRIISVICAVMLLISAVPAWAAAEAPATPTDLTPVPETEVPEEPSEEAVESREIVITKSMAINQSWTGKMGKTKPAVLKLDLNRPGSVYMLVEGLDVWATVEKADRITENPARLLTDPVSGRLIYQWEAEEGSYLITLGPVEPNLLARATVTFMDAGAYLAWEAEQAEDEPESETESVPAEEQTDENVPESEEQPEEIEPQSEEQPEEKEPETDVLPEDRSVSTSITWDDENPAYGSVAHIHVTLKGYEGIEYSLQWQWSEDRTVWNDVEGGTEETLDVVYTPENGDYRWRVLLYIIDPTEE